jgi:hypothetical protein
MHSCYNLIFILLLHVAGHEFPSWKSVVEYKYYGTMLCPSTLWYYVESSVCIILGCSRYTGIITKVDIEHIKVRQII